MKPTERPAITRAPASRATELVMVPVAVEVPVWSAEEREALRAELNDRMRSDQERTHRRGAFREMFRKSHASREDV